MNLNIDRSQKNLFNRLCIIMILFVLSMLLIPYISYAHGQDGAGDDSGTGGGYSSGGSSSNGGSQGFSAFSEVQGTVSVSVGGVFGEYSVGISNDGSFGPSIGPGTFGGNAEVNSTFFNPFNPSPCNIPANLTATVISFTLKDAPLTPVAIDALDPSTSYISNVAVTNTGCTATGVGVVGTNYLNQLPQGQNGTFPVRLQLDFDKDGTIDYDETVNGVGPLGAGVTTIIKFPSFSTNRAGNHEATAIVDPIGTENNGCTGAWGCVKEINEVNELVQPFSVTAPSLFLGSAIYNVVDTRRYVDTEYETDWYGSLQQRLENPLNRTRERDVSIEVADGKQIALVWNGTKVNFSSCTGTNNGSVSDFTGLNDGIVTSNFTGFPATGYDTNITEPSSGNSNVYTIVCNTTSGDSISDTHILNNGGDTSSRTSLIPLVRDITIELGDTLTRYTYRIENNGVTDITEYEHTLKIDTNARKGYVESTQLNAGLIRSYRQLVDWTPPGLGNYPVEVCVSNINGGGSPQECRSGTISVVEPSLPSDVIASTITATPSLVRVNDTVEVSWSPGSDTNCELSPQRFKDFVDNNGGSSPVDFPITGATTLRINCDTTSASVDIRVLPALYEI